MSEGPDEKLDALLRSRRLEAASSDLAQRIVLRAQGMPQNQTISLARRVRQVFTELHLPRPAYVLTAALVLGLVLGFNMPGEVATDSPDTLQLQSFLDGDEEVL
jgi:hypothetical protein